MAHTVFLLGMLAYAQLFFLPGALLLKAMEYRANPLQFFLLSAGLSLVCNYVLVYGLVSLGLYATSIVRSLVGVEILGLLWIYRQALLQPVRHALGPSRWPAYCRYLLRDCFSVYHVLLFVAAIITLVLYGSLFAHHIGQIFHVDDEVNSWNLWALSWAGGHFPEHSSNPPGIYPQLIPINFSLIYVLMGRVVGHPYLVTFARAIMPLFPMACFLILLDLAVRLRETRYLLAIPLLGFIFIVMLGKYIPRGFVDIPLATMTLLAFSLLITGDESDRQLDLKTVIVLAVLAGGIGVTKQGGLYVSLLLPVFTYRLFGAAKRFFMRPRVFWCVFYGIILALIVPWYWHTQLVHHQFTMGNVRYLTHGIYIQEHRNTFFARLGWVLKKTAFPFLPCLMLSIIDMRDNKQWRSMMLFVMPYMLLWAIFFSYDPRNLALTLPILSLSAAGGLERLSGVRQSFALWFMHTVKRVNVAALLLMVVVGISVASVMKKLGYHALYHDQQVALIQNTGAQDPKAGSFHFYPR